LLFYRTNLSSNAPFQEAVDRLLNCIRILPESENAVETKEFVIINKKKKVFPIQLTVLCDVLQ